MQLAPISPQNAASLFAAMGYHLPVHAVLAGDVEGTVYGDDPQQPQVALLACRHRLYAGGSASTPGAAEALVHLLAETFLPAGAEAGEGAYTLAYLPEDWGLALDDALAALLPLREMRQCYTFVGRQDERLPILPSGFALREVDVALLAEGDLLHLDDLREEMCSERASVDEFLARSVGVCALRGRELAGWCLSEYNSGDRCEVGIGVLEPFRRRGLATALTSALIVRAKKQGIGDVGWHCWAGNSASVATARRAGFELVCDYPVYLLFSELENRLAAQGHAAFRAGRYAEALDWHERSWALPRAPVWVAYEAACACARLERPDEALAYLAQAVARGFAYPAFLRASEHLIALHHRPEWDTLMAQADSGCSL